MIAQAPRSACAITGAVATERFIGIGELADHRPTAFDAAAFAAYLLSNGETPSSTSNRAMPAKMDG